MIFEPFSGCFYPLSSPFNFFSFESFPNPLFSFDPFILRVVGKHTPYFHLSAPISYFLELLDFSKAFDKVEIEVLLHKIKHALGNIGCWLAAFLNASHKYSPKESNI